MGFIVAISASIFKFVELLPPKFLMGRFVVRERGSNAMPWKGESKERKVVKKARSPSMPNVLSDLDGEQDMLYCL